LTKDGQYKPMWP